MDDKNYHVYMMTNWKNSVLYTGITSDLNKRVYEHKNKIIAGFSQQYNCTKLVYFESTLDVIAAIEREKQIKRWRRDKKEYLIDTQNPNWVDLSEGWF